MNIVDRVTAAFDGFLAWGTAPIALPYILALLVLVAGGAGMWFKPQWATIPHELGHAFVALLLGRKLSGININQDSSGDTRTMEYRAANPLVRLISMPFYWIRGILVSFAGYPAPFVLGFVLVYLWSHDYTRFGALLMLVLLVFTFLYSTNLFGFLIITIGLIITGIAMWVETPIIRELYVLVIAGGMLSGGVRGTLEAWKVWQQDSARASDDRWNDSGHEPQHSDARALSKKTLLPQVVWLVIFSAVGVFLSGATLVALAQAY